MKPPTIATTTVTPTTNATMTNLLKLADDYSGQVADKDADNDDAKQFHVGTSSVRVKAGTHGVRSRPGVSRESRCNRNRLGSYPSTHVTLLRTTSLPSLFQRRCGPYRRASHASQPTLSKRTLLSRTVPMPPLPTFDHTTFVNVVSLIKRAEIGRVVGIVLPLHQRSVNHQRRGLNPVTCKQGTPVVTWWGLVVREGVVSAIGRGMLSFYPGAVSRQACPTAWWITSPSRTSLFTCQRSHPPSGWYVPATGCVRQNLRNNLTKLLAV